MPSSCWGYHPCRGSEPTAQPRPWTSRRPRGWWSSRRRVPKREEITGGTPMVWKPPDESETKNGERAPMLMVYLASRYWPRTGWISSKVMEQRHFGYGITRLIACRRTWLHTWFTVKYCYDCRPNFGERDPSARDIRLAPWRSTIANGQMDLHQPIHMEKIHSFKRISQSQTGLRHLQFQ